MIAFMAIFVWILLFIIALLAIVISEYKSERMDFALYIKTLKERNNILQKENHELWNEIYKRRN
ncbi:hypothetical protein C7U55_06400 [Faecalibacillus faecis]|jgi:hypothetical protein|uniref:Uncharacterized protein n=1 Tax=Faecalibacillus faecis TaxID=1982628 RepID=A0A2T3FZ34_9FIRM|nr:hypothetical protein C7U55_06400 [Faecalibacillus faecis]